MANERILVLEDQTKLREQMCLALIEAGYRVQAAGTGAEALHLVQYTAFDLIVADIFLPDTSGILLFPQVRALHPEIAGIVVTGHSTWELAVEALNAGFVGFLVKPIVPEQLIASVVNAIEQEKLRRENARLRAVVPLFELSNSFMGNFPLDELLQRIVTVAQRETAAQIVSLMLIAPNDQDLTIAAAAGLPRSIIEHEKGKVGQGIAGRVAQTGEPLMLTENAPLDPEIRKLMLKPEVLSSLSLPLRVRNQVIGVLNLSRMYGDEPFKTGDLEMATVFAGQAAMAIDQARLFDQLKTLNAISQKLASAVDLNEAITALLDAPRQIIHALDTRVWIGEGTVQSSELHPHIVGTHVLIVPREKILAELKTEPETGWVIAPLQHGERVLGLVRAQMPARAAREEQLGALRTLAHTASAVIESHSLHAREMVAFRQVDDAMRADLNLRELLARLLTEMINSCEADGGALFLRDAAHAQIESWVAMNWRGDDTLAQPFVREARAQMTAHPADPTQTMIGAPMMLGNRVEGAVVLTRLIATGGFTTRHLDALVTLTSTAALVIRNAQLYARSEESAITEERTRIAREIHDGLAQDLSYLVFKIGAAQKLASQGKDRELRKELDEISSQLRRDIRDVRHTIFALRPLDIETEGFLPALQKFTKEFAQANEVELELNVRGNATQLAPKLETALFRLIQEALNNIRKHAKAKHVWIDLALDDGAHATLNVRDDGAGFELEKEMHAARARKSFGLLQMRERAERAGGTFALETAPGKGTLIHVALPMRAPTSP